MMPGCSHLLQPAAAQCLTVLPAQLLPSNLSDGGGGGGGTK